MLSNRSFWASRTFPLLAPDGSESGASGGDGAGTSESANTDTKTEQGKDGKEGESEDDDGDLDGLKLGDAGKEAIRKERAAAKAAAERAKDAEKRLAALEKEKTDREADDQKKRDDEAVKKGEFEKLAEQRGVDLDAAKADVTRLTGDVDQLKAAMAEGIKTGWKELPESVRKIGEKQHAEDDVLGRFQFLNDPDTAALVKQLSDKGETARGNGRSPKPGGDGGTVNKEQAQKAQAPLYRRF